MAERQKRTTFIAACRNLGYGEAIRQDEEIESGESEDELDVEDEEQHIENDEGQHREASDSDSDISIEEEGSSSDESISEGQQDSDNEAEGMEVHWNGMILSKEAPLERRQRRNILTERPRPLVNPASEKEAFNLFLNEEILRTTLLHTNRKSRELRRGLHHRDSYSLPFTMDELLAGLSLIIRAGSDRDNFTELQNLWSPGDSKPFYRAVMALRRFKFLLRCLRFDNYHTREQRRQENKFAAVEEIWRLFLLTLRRFYIPGEAIYHY